MSRFCVLPARVLEDPRFTSMTHLRVLMALCTHTDKNGWAFVKRKTMGEKVGVSSSRVSQCARDLKEWGYIEIHEQIRDGVQSANHYRVLFDVGLPIPDAPPKQQTGDAPPVSNAKGGVSGANPPVSDANPPVSPATPPVSAANAGVSAKDLPPRKSLVFTPVVNEGFNVFKSSSNAREAEAVDNSTAEMLLPPEDEKAEQPAPADAHGADPPPSADELAMLGLLRELEEARGKRCAITLAADRPHLQAWQARGLTFDQLREAFRRAVAARDRDRDARSVNAGFLALFVDEVLAPATGGDGGAAWFQTPEGVDAKGAELGQRDRKPDEDWRYYRVLVARAAREPKAIEFVLSDAQRFNAVDLYQFARATFGDALMPVDDYAS